MDSAKMRTQAYTADICIAERSLTACPAADLPNTKEYPLPFNAS